MATAQVVVKEKKRHSLLVDLLIRLVKEKPLGVVGGVITLLLLFFGIFCDLLAPYGFNEIDLTVRLEGPSREHILGCDNLGRDLLSRIIYGARISMFVGLIGSTFNTVLGMLLGGTSGYFGGKYDLIFQRFVDAWMCMPQLFVLLTLITIVGPGIWQVIFVIGISQGIRCRTERSTVIRIKEDMYILAASAIGCSTLRILIRHVLPNVMAPMIVIFSTHIGSVILQEATLSFLGFGIPPPMPSWGGMLSGPGRRYMVNAPWMCFWPGLALALVVYGVNMFGDAVRDLLDPRLRGGLGRYGGVSQEKLQKYIAKRAKE